MAKSTRLDRANWTKVQHSAGSPDANTKGNIFINDTDATFWIKTNGGSWVSEPMDDLWISSEGSLTPKVTGSGLNVSTVGKDIDLSTSDSAGSTSNFNLTTSGGDATTGGNQNFTTSGAVGDFNVTTNSGNGDFNFNSNGSSGNFNVTTDGNNGDINLTTTGTNGDFTIYTSGSGNGQVNISSGGSDGSFNFNTSAGDIGDFLFDGRGSHTGNVTFYTGNNSGDLSFITGDGSGSSDILFQTGAGTTGKFTLNTGVGGGCIDGGLYLTTLGPLGGFTFDATGTSGSTSGNVLFSLRNSGDPAASGLFDVDSNKTRINAMKGILLTNQLLGSTITASIDSVSNAGSSILVSTSTSHQIHPKDNVTLSGSSYDGDYVVQATPSTSSFVIIASYTGTSTGTVTVTDSFGDYGPSFIKIGDQSTSDPLHVYSSSSDVLIETQAAACSTDIILNSSDQIDMNAVGSITADASFSSNLTITANNITNQTLTLSSTNGGAGKGIVNIVGDEVRLNDEWLTTYITLSESGEAALDTTSSSLVGAINEVNAKTPIELYATTTTTSATSDSADMLDAAGSYLTVDDETITAFDVTIVCGATTGARGQASFTGQLVVALDGGTKKVEGFVAENANTTGAGLTISSPAFDVDTGTGNIEITVEHVSTSGTTFEVEWGCKLEKISLSGVRVAS